MRKLLVICFLLVSVSSRAQQVPVYSQYIVHDYLINPAVVGTRDYYRALLTQRLQWVGIEDAPRTSVLSVNGPLKNRKMGLGGYLLNDEAGHTQQRGFYGTYSYIASLSGGVKMSFGLTAGLLAYTIDGTQINLPQSGDQVLSNGLQRSYVPDGSFGFLLYSNRLKLGFSINQLFGSSLTFFEEGNINTGSLTQHFNIHSSYVLGAEESDFDFEPYVLLKFVSPTPLQYDIGLKAQYKKMLWLGGAYRSNESFAVLFGLLFRDNLMLGYSYDIITSDISVRAQATHEITLGIKFQRALPKGN